MELSTLERIAVLSSIAVAAVLFVLGVVLAFKRYAWKGGGEGRWKDFRLRLPGPLLSIVAGAVLALAVAWWLRDLPADSLVFDQKPWTMAEIKERVERHSRLRIDLSGPAASFVIDKRMAGACAADLVAAICRYYHDRLSCELDRGRLRYAVSMKGSP
jgi:hypothetical protein